MSFFHSIADIGEIRIKRNNFLSYISFCLRLIFEKEEELNLQLEDSFLFPSFSEGLQNMLSSVKEVISVLLEINEQTLKLREGDFIDPSEVKMVVIWSRDFTDW